LDVHPDVTFTKLRVMDRLANRGLLISKRRFQLLITIEKLNAGLYHKMAADGIHFNNNDFVHQYRAWE